MTSRRVAVLYALSLLAEGVEAVLKRTKRFEVVGMDLKQEEVWQRLRSFHPDVVIVDRADLGQADGALILQLLRSEPSVKLVCLNMEGRDMDIYSRRVSAIASSEECADRADLGQADGALILQLLRSEPSVKLVCLNMEGRDMDIYSRRVSAIASSEELLHALERE